MFLLRSQPFVLVVLFRRIICIFSLIAFEFFLFLIFYSFTSCVLLICCLMIIVVLTSPVTQTIKPLPTMRETWVQSLGWEDLLEKEMATHSSILAWKIPWTEEPGRLQSMGSQSQTRLSDFPFTLYIPRVT